MKTSWLFIISITVTQFLLAQVVCPFNIENCQGGCGRFIDMDGDGYCDYTVITQFYHLQSQDTSIQNERQSFKRQANVNVQKTTAQSEKTFQYIPPDYAQRIRAKSVLKPVYKRSYRFVLWTFTAFALYGISTLLVRTQVYSKKTHRRIWNILLLITFLVSGILGLLLVLQINYGILPAWYRDFLRWHVEFGIGMAWIGIFHALWHYSYYKNIFSKKQKNEDCQ